MKKYLIVILCIILGYGIGGCKKHHSRPKVPAPTWTVDQTGQYPASMTAVVRVPDNLQENVQKADQIGAFIGDECRGKGQLVVAGENKLFFILIHGTASEQSRISFKYYSSLKSYLYQTDVFLDFTVDGNFGTADNPIILGLQPVE